MQIEEQNISRNPEGECKMEEQNMQFEEQNFN